MSDASSPALVPVGSGPGASPPRGSERGCSERVDPECVGSDLGGPDPGSPDARSAVCRGPSRDAMRSRQRRAPVECGDLPFLILRDGTWLYRGSPIGRKELVCLFASVLRRDEDGGFWLETPVERGRIEVEDAPFVAVELQWTGTGTQQMLSFRTNVDRIVTAGPNHPIRVSHDLLTCEPTPYITVRAGAGRLTVEARIGRAVYYELVALGEPRWVGGQRVLGVWSAGSFFSLGELPPGEN